MTRFIAADDAAMSPRVLVSFVAVALALIEFAGPVRVAAAEPANLGLLKEQIRAYVDSGEYDGDIARVSAEAARWLEQRVPRGGRRLAAVFDIDETLLSNLPHMRRMDFGYLPDPWNAWVRTGSAPPISPVCDLFRTARRLGITVFILSGRSEADRAGTEKNLRAAGVADYAGLCLKNGDAAETTGAFKTAERKRITAEGYTIILNIGDQESDLEGGLAERTFKLPDPFYLTR